MTSSADSIEYMLHHMNNSLAVLETAFFKLPGSAVLARYIRSSHQNDPGRTILELVLAIFAIWTLLQSRTRADKSGKHFVKFSEKEIDELVEEWTPEPLVTPLTESEREELASVPMILGAQGPRPKLASTGKTAYNLASYNFTALQNNEQIKDRAMAALQKYGVGAASPPSFYGTMDVHLQLERDIAQFLGAEAAILYSQGFSTISSVIPAFCKRGDIIVADRGVNFAIMRGIQLSRCTVRWYDHNDTKSLEEVLESVDKEMRKKKAPLTRRMLVTEGIFENNGALVDLPKVVELKYKYKYRLILDESLSFGTVGRTGRGLTELYNVPATDVDMLIGSLATGLSSAGAFCASSRVIVDHQRINGTSFVFSAALPPLLAASASEAISILTDTPSILSTLQENTRVMRNVLDRLDCIRIPSHPASPIIHIYIHKPTPSLTVPNSPSIGAGPISRSGSGAGGRNDPKSLREKNAPVWEIEEEERLLQEVVDEALAQGVLLTRAKRLRGQEAVEPRPSIKLTVTSAFSKKECEKAAGVVKAALVKVLSKRR